MLFGNKALDRVAPEHRSLTVSGAFFIYKAIMKGGNEMGTFYTNLQSTRLGEINTNNFGSIMQIAEYKNAHEVTVKFDNGYITTCEYKSFKKGSVKNPYDKAVCNHGFIGEGKYKIIINSKITPQYIAWSSMLCRCYSPNFHTKAPSYKGCKVCDEWLNFQSFAKWYDENYYQINNKVMCLDKDILFKGNRIYSPQTCVFVPSDINTLFIKCDVARGKYPIGVNYYKALNKYQASLHTDDNKTKCLGYYDSPEDAFKSYKYHKEKAIKDKAHKYKGLVPNKLIKAMIEYKVEIND